MIDKTRLDGLLFAILGDDILVERWWNRPNKAFNNSTPIDIFSKEPERVRDYIFSFASINRDFF